MFISLRQCPARSQQKVGRDAVGPVQATAKNDAKKVPTIPPINSVVVVRNEYCTALMPECVRFFGGQSLLAPREYWVRGLAPNGRMLYAYFHIAENARFAIEEEIHGPPYHQRTIS
jgi:hypothetical protein